MGLVVVEVGASFGEFTNFIMKHVKDSNLIYIAVEPLEQSTKN